MRSNGSPASRTDRCGKQLMPSAKTASSLADKLVVMSFHPVTKEFSEKIERVCGPIDGYYDAASLRKLPLAAGIRELRSVRTEKLVIALENDAARALIGPLSIAAFFSRAKSIEVVW